LTDPIAFFLAAFALLAAPGPTNALLITSGATAGLKQSWMLIPTAAAGYTLGAFILGAAVTPLLEASPLIDAGMRLACAAFLVFMAVMLWREAGHPTRKSEPVKVSRMFTATLLNPKNILFALAIVPHLDDGRLAEAPPYLASMFAMAIGVALGWASAGAVAKATTQDKVDTGFMRRAGAGLLGLFGVLMSISALGVTAS
jgi:threonine/homoserine/homoserine lactone efflux protein